MTSHWGDDDVTRWWGLRRHQCALLLVGLLVAGAATLRHGSRWLEWSLVISLLVLVLPLGSDATVASTMVRTLVWRVRPRCRRGGDVAPPPFLYEFHFRGRLDLSGRDVTVATDMIRLMNAVAQGQQTQLFRWYVHTESGVRRTLMRTSIEVAPPLGWSSCEPSPPTPAAPGWTVERWRYVRDHTGVRQFVLVRSFSDARHGAVINTLLQAGPDIDVTILADVVALTVSRRRASRAVHRVHSDGVVTQAAGFRRTALATDVARRAQHREELVVAGHPLVNWSVLVAVRAPTLSVLEERVADLRRRAAAQGVYVSLGAGRQRHWSQAHDAGAC